MKGNILGFDPHTHTGAISGHDGNRYDFVTLDWRSQGAPRRGEVVDFVPEAGRATAIYPVVVRHDPAAAGTANVVYILYLISLVAGITGLVGLIIAYVNRADAPDWLQSHYRLQIRTFWIGLLYGVISLATALIVIGIFFALFTLVWWIVRCAKGMEALSRGEAYENAAAWLW